MWQLSLCEPSISSCETAEFRVAAWLNKISGLFGACTTSNTTSNSLVFNPPWLWNSDACQRPLKAKTKCKPDIILTNDYMPHSQTSWGWGDVHAFIKVTLSYKLTAGLKSTLHSKAFMIFQAQQNCHFVLALAIC